MEKSKPVDAGFGLLISWLLGPEDEVVQSFHRKGDFTVMKKMLRVIGLTALMASFPYAQYNQVEIVSRDLIEKFAGEVSGKIALEHIRDLSVFCRWYGSDDMIKAAEFVKSKAQHYGLSDVRIEKFKVDAETYYYMQKPWHAWNCESGELRMVEPRNKLITSYEANGPCVLVNSRDADITAEVVYVGTGTSPKDYEGKDVRGKIVLASGYPWEVSKQAVFERGAAGVLVSWMLDTPGSHSTEIYQTRIAPWNKDKTKVSTFGFFLSTNQGRILLQELDKGKKVVVQAKVKAEVRVPGYHPGVVATIPGSAYPEEEIIFTAHLDHPRPGAHDNNSGCALLLETARVIQSLIDQKLIDPPKRTIRFYWTPHVWGVDMLFQTYPERIARTIANINVDCVGLNQTKFSSGFTVTKAPFTRASFLDDIVVNILNYLILSNNNHMGQLPHAPMMIDHDGTRNVFYGRVVPYVDYSDHVFFSSGNVGIPAVTFIDLPFGSHHSQNDKFDLIDATQLKRISFLAAVASYCIAAAGPEESFGIIDEIYHCGQSRIENEMKLSKSLLRIEDKIQLIHQYKKARNLVYIGHQRERQALQSTKLFIKGARAAADYLSKALKKMDSSEQECLNDIKSLYHRQCRRMKIKPEDPELSKEELQLKNIIPRRNADLKGAWGILNTYPDDRYAFQKYSPMHAYLFEVLNRMDGQRNMLEIVQAVEAEALSSNYPRFSLDETMDFLAKLKEQNIIDY